MPLSSGEAGPLPAALDSASDLQSEDIQRISSDSVITQKSLKKQDVVVKLYTSFLK